MRVRRGTRTRAEQTDRLRAVLSIFFVVMYSFLLWCGVTPAVRILNLGLVVHVRSWTEINYKYK